MSPPKRGSRATRVTVTLVCTECQSRNYQTTKKREAELEIKKFCRTCGRHTTHRASK